MLLLLLLLCSVIVVAQQPIRCNLHADCFNRPALVCRGQPCPPRQPCLCIAVRCGSDSDCPLEYHSACRRFFCNLETNACDVRTCNASGLKCDNVTHRCLTLGDGVPPIHGGIASLWLILFIVTIVFIIILVCWLAAPADTVKRKTRCAIK